MIQSSHSLSRIIILLIISTTRLKSLVQCNCSKDSLVCAASLTRNICWNIFAGTSLPCFSSDEVVSFNSVVMVDEVFINLIGAALFLQILQLLWVLKFNKTLAELSATIGHSMEYLKSFFVSLLVIFVAFAMVAHHMYGTELWNYRDFLHVCYSQLISILGKFDANELVLVGGDFGRVVFMSYQLTLLYIFINLLIAIINETLADIHGGKIHVEFKDDVFDLLIEKLGWTRKKNEAGSSSETKA